MMHRQEIEHIPVFSSPSQLFKPVAREYPDDHLLAPHWHHAAQLIYAESGVMELSCQDSFWIISPQQALWMPSELPHRLKARGQVSLRSVYFQPDALPERFSKQPQSLVVSPLLRELMKSAMPVTSSSPPSSREVHLMHLLMSEIGWAQEIPLKLPMPKDNRLQKICLGLLADPGNDCTLSQWGEIVGASPRTLSRLFQTQLGTSFAIWRQQARIFAAIPRLNLGEPIVRVAMEMGYDSAGAFASAFKKMMGVTPSEFRTQVV